MLPATCKHCGKTVPSSLLSVLTNTRYCQTVSAVLPHAANCVWFCFWSCLWRLFCLCMKYLENRWTDLRQIHTEDVFVPPARISLNVKVRGQRSRLPGTYFLPIENALYRALAANNVMQQQTGPFRHCRGWWECTDVQTVQAKCDLYVAACVRFMFGKTSLALV